MARIPGVRKNLAGKTRQHIKGGERVTISTQFADMLNRIRNAVMARHDSVQMPASKDYPGIAKILKEEGFIKDFEVVKKFKTSDALWKNAP